MTIFETYILRRVFQMFLTALLPVLGIIWTTQALQRINLVTDTGQSMGAFLQLATLILPTIIPLVLPFALVIGVTQTLTTMNSDSELTVIEAAGGSRSIVVRPIMMLSVVLALFSFAVDDFIEPIVRQAARQMIATAHADLLSSVVQENTFRKVADGLYVQVASRRNNGVLGGIFVADSRDPGYELIYYAREGAVDETSSALVMRDGEVHRKLPDGGVSIIKFDSYAFDLTDLTKMADVVTIRAQDRSLGYLLAPDVTEENYKKNPGAYDAELHRRFTEWTFPILFGLIALVVSSDARSHREARLHPMARALMITLVVRWATFYAANNAEDSRVFIPLMYIIPLATGIITIRQLAGNRRLSMPVSSNAKLTDLLDRVRHPLRRKSSGGRGAPDP
ncbi:MAG TPA: LPS export ABC transporter permease LptF [Pararhizobium sp.]|uniref:LPS export ABC transporter permease LptF n=1 Tax=Pararhizobium sp. TaxID=1977563 RepID=UPI002CBE3271|nr:LPS export ABC transporter permease LptF [Pararhizobium sp.]HTO30901.1 LPS export ABC transporter permease LptF [Pararhizobium sp.]